MSKTPFEIRTELLTLATEICNRRSDCIREQIERDWMVEHEIWSIKASNGDIGTCAPYPAIPSVTTDEVIAEAKKLNEFVSKG